MVRTFKAVSVVIAVVGGFWLGLAGVPMNRAEAKPCSQCPQEEWNAQPCLDGIPAQIEECYRNAGNNRPAQGECETRRGDKTKACTDTKNLKDQQRRECQQTCGPDPEGTCEATCGLLNKTSCKKYPSECSGNTKPSCSCACEVTVQGVCTSQGPVCGCK